MNKQIKLAVVSGALLMCPLVLNQKQAEANTVNDYIVNKAKNNNWKPAPEQNQVASHLPKNPYRLGVGRPEMIINHESANNSDQGSWINEVAYMLRNYQNAFVHNWTGSKEGTVAIADDRYLSWGAGPSGNWRGLQIEQAREVSKDGFAQALLNLAGQNARWMKAYNMPVTMFNPNTKTGTVGTHAQVSQAWRESDHTDPNGYWADMARRHFGSTYTLNDFFALTEMVYNDQLQPTKPVYKAKFSNNQKVLVWSSAGADFNGKDIKPYRSMSGNITKTTQKTKSNSHFYYTVKLENGKVFDILEQDLVTYAAPKFKTGDDVTFQAHAGASRSGENIVKYRGQSGKITWAGAHEQSNSKWVYDVKLANGTVVKSVLEQDFQPTVTIKSRKPMDKMGTIDSSNGGDVIWQNQPADVYGAKNAGNTKSYNGWYAYIKEEVTLSTGYVYYLTDFNGTTRYVHRSAFKNLRDMPKLVNENKDQQFRDVKTTATDIRTGDPRWNKQSSFADGNAIKNSNPAKSSTVKITSVKEYSDGSAWALTSQNGQERGWVNVNDFTKRPELESDKVVIKNVNKTMYVSNDKGVVYDSPYVAGKTKTIGNTNGLKDAEVKINQESQTAAGLWYNSTIVKDGKTTKGWIKSTDLTATKPTTPIKPVEPTDPTDPVKPTDPEKETYKVTIKNIDANTQKEIGTSTTKEVKKGVNTFEPDTIKDYNKPVSQTVDVSKDQTIIFKHSYKYQNIRNEGINVNQLNDDQKAWIETVIPSVNKVANGNGFYGSVMLSQAILETGYGQSDLAKEANNFFGIKAGADWKGPIYTKETKEVVNGKEITVKANFRKYATPEEGFQGYADKLAAGSSYGDKDFYKDVYATSNNNYVITARALTGKWATDPNYGEKLISIIERMDLFKLDGLTAKAKHTAPLTIRGVDTSGKQLWTETKEMELGTIETIKPKAVNNYDTPLEQTVKMDIKDGKAISFTYVNSEAVLDTDNTTYWYTTTSGKAVDVYKDNFLTSKIGEVKGDVTVTKTQKLKSGRVVFEISQSGERLGFADAKLFTKKQPLTYKADNKTQWLTTKSNNTQTWSDDRLSKAKEKVTGNVTVTEVRTYSDGLVAAKINQSGKDKGWIDYKSLKEIPKPVTVTKKAEDPIKDKRGLKVTKDTPIYSESLNGKQVGNTKMLTAKNVTVTKTHTLSNGKKMIYITQQGSTGIQGLGWIDEPSTGPIK